MRIVPLALSLGLLAFQASHVTGQDWTAEPTYGKIELSGGFAPDPLARALTAGGSNEVAIEGCSYGFVAEAPDVDLVYETGGSTTLYISVQSDDDTTLLINLPDGTWACDDDGLGGRNPLVVLQNAPEGLYDIWVGTYGDEMVAAALLISEKDPRGKGK
jgi:hypothetical protein